MAESVCAWCKNVKMRKDTCGMICKIKNSPVNGAVKNCKDYQEYKK